MKFRTHRFSTTLVYAVTLTVFMLVIFALVNAGIDPRVGRGDFDPKNAAMVCFGMLGLYHSVAIIFFDDDDSPTTREAAADAHIPRAPDSYTGFIRQAWYKVLSVGPIFAVFCMASVFIWHSFAEFPGTLGTVWGDYTASPLPALALFLLCWAAASIGFTLAAVAEAFNRDRRGLFITAMIVMFIVGLGITAWFFFLPDQRTGTALTIAALALPLSLLTLIGARAWAIARVSRYDAAHPRQSARQRRRQARFGPRAQRQACPGSPPHDMLRRGEELLMHFKSERTAEPQMLIATNQRFVRASILGSDRTFVLEQASPGQLTGADSQRMGPDLLTTAHFRDSQDMRVVGGDPEQSRAFAEAVSRLARTGRIRP
ncbi:hypothetical protein [Brevibacterium marinum]|uniref:Uncharacterized protein n=1 Tax=Brevibacterium marinum TaxID=418643 RepID=A0A846RT51_9MICO|nr:hypothetical protein [Brevibacterium marinum]NJC55146.1 hypothetical protein [Brevibacterium marinum]